MEENRKDCLFQQDGTSRRHLHPHRKATSIFLHDFFIDLHSVVRRPWPYATWLPSVCISARKSLTA